MCLLPGILVCFFLKHEKCAHENRASNSSEELLDQNSANYIQNRPDFVRWQSLQSSHLRGGIFNTQVLSGGNQEEKSDVLIELL